MSGFTIRLCCYAIAVISIACEGAERSAETSAERSGAGERGGVGITAEDQSNQEGDLALTQRIRQAIVADDSLSMTAENVNIVTVDGKVTLRGAVKNEQEKTRIESTASHIAGSGRVESQLVIAGSGY